MCCLSSLSVCLLLAAAISSPSSFVNAFRVPLFLLRTRTESTQSCECKPVFLGTASLDEVWFLVCRTRSQRQASAVRACVRAFFQLGVCAKLLLYRVLLSLFCRRGGGNRWNVSDTLLLSWSVFLVRFVLGMRGYPVLLFPCSEPLCCIPVMHVSAPVEDSTAT